MTNKPSLKVILPTTINLQRNTTIDLWLLSMLLKPDCCIVVEIIKIGQNYL
jgi:hypothetical protein